MMMTIMRTGIYLVFDFFHFQKKYKPTPDRAYIPMNIYIGFTLSPKRYAMRRLRAVLNYFSSFTNDDLITFLPSSNMMVRLALFPSAICTIVPLPKTLCLILSPMSNSAIYVFPPPKKPQQIQMAYIMIMIMTIKYKDSIYLFQQFISSITSITRISKMGNHSMNDITQGKIVLILNSFKMFVVLIGGTEIKEYRFLNHKIM